MNTDINLNTSFTFAPKVLIVQLQAGLLTIPPFDLPSHQWGLFRILTGFPLRMELKKQLHQPNLHYKITKQNGIQ